jgi:cytoskeletal protein CcmA (bactofilin family)
MAQGHGMFGKTEKGAMTSGGGALSFIGADVTVTGNIGGKGSLHIDGRVDGDVGCSSVTLGQNGQINGNLTADDARIAGTIAGTVAAKSLMIDATARITGDLSYDSVSVESGAMVEGRVKRLTRDDASPLKLIANE